jgi:transposase
VIGDAEFPATAAGYRRAIRFLAAAGMVDRVGVEGAASYGAGISCALRQAEITVVEVERPSRSTRRRAGKSDQLDAYHAARAVLAERTSPVKDPALAGLRALHRARCSAVKARTAAGNQIKSILVTAPEPIRAEFRGMTVDQLVSRLLRCRGFYADPIVADTLVALRVLAERHRGLSRQIETLTARIDPLVTSFNPALRAGFGVGPDVAAQLLITAGNNPDRLISEASFAALCGVAPVPASSGKTRPSGSPAAETGRPTVPCTRSRSSGWPTIQQPSPTCTAKPDRNGLARKSCGHLNEQSFARSTATSQNHAWCRNGPTYDQPGRPRTSPSLPPRNTSVSAPPSSPDSNAGCNATTTSPLPTGIGSLPPNPGFRRRRHQGRRADAVKMQRPTGRTILTAPSTGLPSPPAEPLTAIGATFGRRTARRSRPKMLETRRAANLRRPAGLTRTSA